MVYRFIKTQSVLKIIIINETMGNFENSMFRERISPIENLPDDCLRTIFQYLPIADRFRIERGYSLVF